MMASSLPSQAQESPGFSRGEDVNGYTLFSKCAFPDEH